jgi:hypothetical protein
LLDQKKVSKKNQEIAKAIAINCDHQTKAKMSPRLQHFLRFCLFLLRQFHFVKKLYFKFVLNFKSTFA